MDIPLKSKSYNVYPSSPLKLSSPINSPILLLGLKQNNETQNDNSSATVFEECVHSLLYSRKIANKIMLAYAISQICLFGFLSWSIAQLHLVSMYKLSQTSTSLLDYFLKITPGLVILPITAGMIVWPSFIVFGSFKSHDSQDLDTVENHLHLLRQMQAGIYAYLLDRSHKKEARYVFSES